ncbi:MAG: DUF47 domain-containing protein [Candidatus Saccharibacteria bacterium]
MALHLKPRDNDFFDYFNESSQAVLDGARILKEYVYSTDDDPQKRLEVMSKIEAHGDKVFSTVLDKLGNSFVTPFEREDIYTLARELYNILDYIQGIMERMILYKTGEPKDDNIKTLVEVLEKAALEIQSAVMGLKSLKRNYRQVLESCDKIKEYESEGDYLYRTGIALLFEQVDNAIEIIKWKEIFEHLETALDHCEDISNIVKGVAVKYA